MEKGDTILENMEKLLEMAEQGKPYIINKSDFTSINTSSSSRKYVQYKLNVDKVESIDDCKKILKFLCDLTIKPLPIETEYRGFSKVEKYFK